MFGEGSKAGKVALMATYACFWAPKAANLAKSSAAQNERVGGARSGAGSKNIGTTV